MNLLQKRLKELDGAYLHVKIREMARQLKYAWNRALYGYDEDDIYCLNSSFTERMTELLKQFRAKNIGTWPIHGADFEFMSQEEVNQILDEMICCFEKSNPDNVYVFDDTFDFQKMQEYNDIVLLNRKKAFELFEKWFDDLWI